MQTRFGRRAFLEASAIAGLVQAAPALVRGDAPRHAAFHRIGTPQPFDFDRLRERARALARSADRAPDRARIPRALRELDWDRYQSIRFRPEHALWAERGAPFAVKFFHLGRGYTDAVRMHEVESGTAHELAYSGALFDYGKSGLDAGKLPETLGFAGFQLITARDRTRDVAAFLGASYFRAVGEELQYGLSARGLAIDCGLSRPEEFPRFTAFWFERPDQSAENVTVYALLESQSATGAYRFELRPGRVLVMEVDARIYLRRAIERLGIAPLTSMFQYAENDRRAANDWRPEIHDSDGLCLHTGRGEWIFRPLTNPARMRVNSFMDENPRGFGLLQRDRDFDHYQDDGVFYERRPNLWIEPLADWGKGAVQLVELPADDETSDNIVAFWNPALQTKPGEELALSYRMHWGTQLPESPPLARAVATRTGLGGVVGRPRDHFSWRFVVDFAGGPLERLGAHAGVEPVIDASRGTIELSSARVLHSVHGYRVMFDLKPNAGDVTPVDLRMFLRAGNRTLTETWMYQWTPPELRTA